MRGQTRTNSCNGVVALIIALLVPWIALAADTLPAARVKVDQPIFDFGTVAQGTIVSHEYTLKNIGNADLHIHRVVPACGCTAATVSGDVIAPGATGNIAVRLDTSDFSGEKLKMIRVFTSDPEDSSLSLTLKGVIESNVELEPRRVNFDRVSRGAALAQDPREVRISVRPDAGLEISDVRSFSKHVIVRMLEHSPREARISISLDPLAPVGELRDRAIVNLKGSKDISVNIPIYAHIEGPLKLNPGIISVGIIEGSEIIERSVKFDNSGAEPVKIRALRSSDPAITADYSVIKEGQKYVVHVKVDPSKVSRDLKGAVTVETDSKNEAPLTLNVFGILPPKV